jgi:hypothetical protein
MMGQAFLESSEVEESTFSRILAVFNVAVCLLERWDMSSGLIFEDYLDIESN